MTGVVPYIQLKAHGNLPLYEQLCRSLRAAIINGTLATGSRIASTRDLAQAFSISRSTVVVALERLHSEGYLVARRGSGTFVVDILPDRLMGARIRGARRAVAADQRHPALSRRGTALSSLTITGPRDDGSTPRLFHPRRPPLDIFPLREWARLIRRQWVGSGRRHLDYGDPGGLPALREAIARHVAVTRGIDCSPAQVIVMNGSQQAFDVLFRVLLDPDEEAWIEDPAPLEIRGALMAAGARPVAVPMNEGGIDVSHGIKLAPHARLAVVSPSHQYPTGATLTAARRRALLDWSAAAGAWIVEDDYDSHFRYQGRPMASLFGLDSRKSGVIYVGTFSKTMFPSLRLGFCIVPEVLVDPVSNARAIADRNAPIATQAALAEFIDSGQYDRHLRRVRLTCLDRYNRLRDSFTHHLGAIATLEEATAGTHVLLRLADDEQRSGTSRAERISRACLHANLVVFPVSRYYLVRPEHDALVLGYGAMSPKRIDEGVRTLADIIDATV